MKISRTCWHSLYLYHTPTRNKFLGSCYFPGHWEARLPGSQRSSFPHLSPQGRKQNKTKHWKQNKNKISVNYPAVEVSWWFLHVATQTLLRSLLQASRVYKLSFQMSNVQLFCELLLMFRPLPQNLFSSHHSQLSMALLLLPCSSAFFFSLFSHSFCAHMSSFSHLGNSICV